MCKISTWGKCINAEKVIAFTAKETLLQETEKFNEYRIELDILNKMMEEKYGAYLKRL